VVLVVAADEVLEHGAALKDADLLAVGQLVRKCRDAAIGVDLEEPVLLLLIVLHVDLTDLSHAFSLRLSALYSRLERAAPHLVLEAQLLEEDGDLDAIGRVDRVEDDVCLDTHVCCDVSLDLVYDMGHATDGGLERVVFYIHSSERPRLGKRQVRTEERMAGVFFAERVGST
jgi:hypothetical protein